MYIVFFLFYSIQGQSFLSHISVYIELKPILSARSQVSVHVGTEEGEVDGEEDLVTEEDEEDSEEEEVTLDILKTRILTDHNICI